MHQAGTMEGHTTRLDVSTENGVVGADFLSKLVKDYCEDGCKNLQVVL
jgi:hypothetical protein